MADLNVRLDARETEYYLRTHGPRRVANALRSAVRTTTTWAEKESDRRLAAATAIPVQVFRRFRVKKRLFGGNAGIERGLVWSGYNPIKARFAGRMTQNEGGATAGAYYFAGAFIATMPSGLTAIFKRRGASGLPIDEQTVSIPQAAEIAEQVAADAGPEFIRRFRAKFTDG